MCICIYIRPPACSREVRVAARARAQPSQARFARKRSVSRRRRHRRRPSPTVVLVATAAPPALQVGVQLHTEAEADATREVRYCFCFRRVKRSLRLCSLVAGLKAARGRRGEVWCAGGGRGVRCRRASRGRRPRVVGARHSAPPPPAEARLGATAQPAG